MFIGYRVFLFSYLFIWLILHADTRSSAEGPFWLTQITNLSYSLLNIAELSVLILCCVYAILYCVRRPLLSRYIPRNEISETSVYSQDNIPWCVKIVWILYTIALPTNFMVVFGYWIFVYGRCGSDDAIPGLNVTASSNTSTTPVVITTTIASSCNTIDAPGIHVHLVNGILILIDIFISRMPFQLLHFFYPCVSMFFYSLFTIFFWVGGGTNPSGDPYIYSVLDYGNRPATSFAFAFFLILAPMLFHFVLCPLALLRDFIYSRIPFCYRNLRESPFDDVEMKRQLSENGISENKGSSTSL